MLVVAAAGLLLEALLRLRRGRGAGGRARGVAVLAPVVYGGAAVVMLMVTDRGSVGVRETMDVVATVVAGVGLIAWLALRLIPWRRAAAGRGSADS